MRFYCICDRIDQKKFNVYWQKRGLNKGDYHHKHHPPYHHRTVRPKYLHVSEIKHSCHLQGCVNLELGAIDVFTVKTGAQGVCRQITQYIRFLYSCCKVQTIVHPIFHKYIRYNNNNKVYLYKIPKQNGFNKNSLI